MRNLIYFLPPKHIPAVFFFFWENELFILVFVYSSEVRVCDDYRAGYQTNIAFNYQLNMFIYSIGHWKKSETVET